MRPGIRAVHRYIDWDISDQLDSPLIGIGFQLVPLEVKLILQILLEFNIKIQFPTVIVHGIAPAQADIFCPFRPLYAIKPVFNSHKKGIIRKPPVIFGNKLLVIRIFMDMAALIGLAKQRITAKIKFFIVNIALVLSKIYRVAFFFCQNALLNQRFQADKVRISRKRGK